MRILLALLSLLLIWGCSGVASPVGNYKVEVPQSAGKVAEVGKLSLGDDGKFSMNTGQLEMKGSWSQEGDHIRFSSSDPGVQMLSSRRFRLDGNKLVPVGEDGDQKHWYLTKE